MQTLPPVIRGPPEFRLGDDADLFMERLTAVAEAFGCENAGRFGLLKSCVDDSSLRRILSIEFLDEHRTGGTVDLSKDSVRILILEAIRTKPTVPEVVELKYRMQLESEGIVAFGDGIRELGQKIFGADAERNSTVITSFCAGLRDEGLAAKMLRYRNFGSLREAVDFAATRKGKSDIKNFLDENRVGSIGVDQIVGDTGHVRDRDSVFMTGPQCYRCFRFGHIRRTCEYSGSAKGSGLNGRRVSGSSGDAQQWREGRDGGRPWAGSTVPVGQSQR